LRYMEIRLPTRELSARNVILTPLELGAETAEMHPHPTDQARHAAVLMAETAAMRFFLQIPCLSTHPVPEYPPARAEMRITDIVRHTREKAVISSFPHPLRFRTEQLWGAVREEHSVGIRPSP